MPDNEFPTLDEVEAYRAGKELEDVRQLAIENMQNDFRELFFGTKRGRRVLGQMLILSDFFGLDFTGNSKTYFLQGMKWFVKLILAVSGMDTLEGLQAIQKEALELEEEHNNNLNKGELQ